MFEKILNCKLCSLCNNQKPLLDNKYECDVMWIGLSAKHVENISKSIPLENNTNSGKIIEKIENNCKDVKFYKTNLVKCLPLNCNNKIRYPRKEEMDICIQNLILEIKTLKPKVVFMLGNKVGDFITDYISINKIEFKFDVKFYKIYHPSYIYIYKKKYIQEYIDDVINKIYI